MGNRKTKTFQIIIFYLFLAVRVFAVPQMTTTVPAHNEIDAGSFSFAVIGDSQPKNLFGQPEVLKKIISEINKFNTDFIVHLGDKISGSRDSSVVREQYKEFLQVIKELKVPIHYTVGNHEICRIKDNEEIHRELFGPLYHSFVHKNCLFLVLNTDVVGNEGMITNQQLVWLKDELEKSRDMRYIFVFLHRPLFSVLERKKNYRDFISEEHRDEVTGLLKSYGVSAVFAGHEHLYHSDVYDGLVQIISGGGGAPFHFYPLGNFYHYLLIEVTEKNAFIRCIPVTP